MRADRSRASRELCLPAALAASSLRSGRSATQATATLMDSFYFELARGRTPAEALRRAQLRLASDARWSAPRLWAGFVLTGEPPPVEVSREAPWLLMGTFLAAVAAVALWRRGVSRA